MMLTTLCLTITVLFSGLNLLEAQQIDGCDLCTRRVSYQARLSRRVTYQVQLTRQVPYQVQNYRRSAYRERLTTQTSRLVRLSSREAYYVSTTLLYITSYRSWLFRYYTYAYKRGPRALRYRTKYQYVRRYETKVYYRTRYRTDAYSATRYRSQSYYVTRYRTQYYYVTRYWTMNYCCVDSPSKSTMEGHIQLVDGPTLNEGRLMINYNQHYGAVCTDRFDTRDANTVCHQLGFAGQKNITGCCPYGVRPHGNIWLDELGCTSQDVWLANCTHRGWGVEDCHNTQEVGLKCNSSLNLRLSGGKHPFEGRVEQYYAGTWGTVCDDGWDMNEARVVCRQLGLGDAVKAVGGALFGQGQGYTMLSNVDCIGHESALGWCLHSGWRRRTCSHSKDASVACKGPVPENFTTIHIACNSISFTFDLPKQLQFTDVVKEYRVVFNLLPIQPGRSRSLYVTPTNPKSVKPQFNVTGLSPAKSYTFKVAIVSSRVAGGIGPFSKSVNVTTPQVAPGRVIQFSGRSVNASCIQLSMRPPIMSDCNVVNYYKLSYRSLSRGDDNFSVQKTVTISSPVANNKILICELRSNINYKFTIAAVNGAGKGPRMAKRIRHLDPSFNGK